jgi:hypothetical protein
MSVSGRTINHLGGLSGASASKRWSSTPSPTRRPVASGSPRTLNQRKPFSSLLDVRRVALYHCRIFITQLNRTDESETEHERDGEPTALISARDETIRVLEEQLRKEREVRRRAATIIAQLTQANAALAARVPELEAPREAPGAPETAAEEPGGHAPSESLAEVLGRPHRPGRGGGGSSSGLRRRGLAFLWC